MTDTIQSINKHLRGLDAELERERKQLKHAFFCGNVSHPDNVMVAIDTHEEEMRYLMADAKEEFGI